ncbi:MAG: type II toxin-antitoxin system RelE/ParE family toxin [Clostridia bacterium]|nr:type II toxin-antitoxin system RelE/ParE family toxin [Clostridia bacterium]
MLLWIRSILDKYSIVFWKKARRDLDDIYAYIATECMEPEIARSVIGKIQETIQSLETMPNRYREIRQGKYAKMGYRKVSVKKFIIFYKVSLQHKKVSIVTIQHEARDM